MMMKNVSASTPMIVAEGLIPSIPRSTQAAVYSATPMCITIAETIDITASQSRQFLL